MLFDCFVVCNNVFLEIFIKKQKKEVIGDSLVKNVSNAKIAEVIRKNYGNITVSANNLGMNRSTMYLRINKSPELKKVVLEGRESLVDIAESALLKNIVKGDTASIIFALKTQGKDRGYVEKVENDTNLSGKVEVVWGGSDKD